MLIVLSIVISYVTAIKFLIAVAFVLGMSLLAEYVSPKVAGIISGYPTGSAIVLFFFGLEQGAAYAASSALYNMVGLTAMCVFVFVYWLFSRIVQRFSCLLSSLAALAAYLLAAYLLGQVSWGMVGAILLSALTAIALMSVMKKVQNVKIKRIPFRFSVIVWRAVLAAFMILFITLLPFVLPVQWAGLFSAFPSTLFPLLIIIHLTYEKAAVHTIIKNVPVGLFSLLLYSLTVHLAYPALGIYFGTLLAYGVATATLVAIFQMDHYFSSVNQRIA